MFKTNDGVMHRLPLTEANRSEMIGCIIDTFEDYITEHADEFGGNNNDEAIITESDYDDLTKKIESILIDAGVLDSSEVTHHG